MFAHFVNDLTTLSVTFSMFIYSRNVRFLYIVHFYDQHQHIDQFRKSVFFILMTYPHLDIASLTHRNKHCIIFKLSHFTQFPFSMCLLWWMLRPILKFRIIFRFYTAFKNPLERIYCCIRDERILVIIAIIIFRWFLMENFWIPIILTVS